MERRELLATASGVVAAGAGCLGPLSRTKTVPVTVSNTSESEKRLTVEVINEKSKEEVFTRAVVVPADEESKFEIEGIRKGTAYTVPITTESGTSKEARIGGPTRALRIVIKENAEIQLSSTVS